MKTKLVRYGILAGATVGVFAALAAAGPVKGGIYAGFLKGDRTADESVVFQISSDGKKAKGIGGSFAAADASGCDRDEDKGESYSDGGKAPIKDNGFKEKLDIFPTSKRADAVGTSKIVVKFKGNGAGKGTVNVRYTDPEACDYKDKFVAHAFE